MKCRDKKILATLTRQVGKKSNRNRDIGQIIWRETWSWPSCCIHAVLWRCDRVSGAWAGISRAGEKVKAVTLVDISAITNDSNVITQDAQAVLFPLWKEKKKNIHFRSNSIGRKRFSINLILFEKLIRSRERTRFYHEFITN